MRRLTAEPLQDVAPSVMVPRVATVGAGGWGERHVSALAGLPGVEFRGVWDADVERASTLADRYSGTSYDSLSSLLDDQAIDAVTVALPDHLHAEAVVACLMAGKHVYVEKPFATTLEDCKAMSAAADAAGVGLMVGFASRFMVPLIETRNALGATGQPLRHIRIVQRNSLFVPTKLIRWSSDSNILWWLGSHSFDTARWLARSPITAVSSTAGRGRLDGLGINTPDYFITMLRFANGATAVVENSWILPESFPTLVDWRIEAFNDSTAVFVDPVTHRAVEVIRPEGIDRPDLFYDTHVDGIPRGGFIDAIAHFVRCVVTGETPSVTAHDGTVVTATILAALDSADHDGRWTPVEDA
jgi:predicted dehydrogenase